MTNQQLVAAAAALGHTAWRVEANRSGRLRMICDCGYVSTYRNSERDCVGAALHHLKKAVAADRVNGRVAASRTA